MSQLEGRLDWEHVVTVCHPDIKGKRIPAVRVTKEKGSRLPELRLSYTHCFYDEVDNRLHTVLHLPGRHAEAFATMLVTAVTVMRYSGTADPDMLALKVLGQGARAISPETAVEPHQGGAKVRSSFGTNLGEAIKKRVRS